jgi:hypothetical protein
MAILSELVPEFQHYGELVDWIHLQGAASFDPPVAAQLAASSA